MFLSCAIDAQEKRGVATCDIPGMFLQTGARPGTLYVVLRGEMLEIFLSVAPELEEFVEVVNGKRVLFSECKKTLYGSLQSGKLSYLKLCKLLLDNGFVANPYEPCWFNKMVKGAQLSVLFHVNNLKISHVDPAAVDAFIALTDREYGQEAPLTVRRGKTHVYLGFTIDYSTPNEVMFSMHEFLQKTILEFPDKDNTFEYVTPAAGNLFSVDPNSEPLSESKGRIFHTLTAKGLFASKRCRPDIQVPISFLTTRVHTPTVQNWHKLKRLIGYLRATIGLPLIIRIDGTGRILIFIDGSFAAHTDMRGHTGTMTTMGKGAMLSSSSKQKINTRSSTGCEVVAVDEGITKPLWMRNLLLSQNQQVTDCILFQDNQASMQLEKNGFASAGKRSRHFDICFFFCTDLVKRGELSIEYCPTLEMVADVMTKPLQGAQFEKFRNAVLGITADMIPECNKRARKYLESVNLN